MSATGAASRRCSRQTSLLVISSTLEKRDNLAAMELASRPSHRLLAGSELAMCSALCGDGVAEMQYEGEIH